MGRQVLNRVLPLVVLLVCTQLYAQATNYPWLSDYDPEQSLVKRIPLPHGYTRKQADAGSFAEWIRALPLKKGKPKVHLYDGSEKYNQSAHHAVVDMDVGTRNLQQCADAVIRLRAEYLYSKGMTGAIHFNFTSGDRADYKKWTEGYRPRINGNNVSWVKSRPAASSYEIFRSYLDTVFAYAGSYSLSLELQAVENIEDMRIGDVFIQGGFPGHAVIVMDMAETEAGHKVFILAQSYMPAQEIHILKNPLDQELSPWYKLDFGQTLATPEWVFTSSDLKRFKAPQ